MVAGKGGIGILAVVLVPVLVVALSMWVLFFGGASASACTVGSGTQISVDGIAADAAVGGYTHDQLVNAALIANAAVTLGLPAAAQTLGVQTAIGESTLRNIDYGDGAMNPDGSVADSIGLFQQQSSWGSVAQRMDPTSAATLFFARLPGIAGWETMDPSLAINTVQGNADPNYYTQFRADAVAIMTFLTGAGPAGAGGGGCAVSGDAKALAMNLVAAIGTGKLVLAEDRYAAEIRGVADGSASSICGIDVRILQVITIALNNFDQVGVSDLNRQCTGSIEGAGTESAHWINGGGHAVDFYSLNGLGLTGCDTDSMKLLSILDPLVPAGSRAGQAQCRTATYSHVIQFQDTPNHLHFDVGFTDGPVTNP
jgi:hypothetical protein